MSSSQMLVFLPLIILISFGSSSQAHHAVPYDHSFTHECLRKPLKPQYGGGIVVNPELDQGLTGWTQTGDAKLEHRRCNDDGNNYVVAPVFGNRTSILQRFRLEPEKLYTFSGWLQVSSGSAYIKAVFETETEDRVAGWVAAQEGCWSMLKGGFVVNASTINAGLYFESNNPTTEIWIDSISLLPFTHEEWKSHQDRSVENVRKGKVKFQVIDEQGRPVPDATVSVKQTRPTFPLGCAINSFILQHPEYQEWFLSRFKYTVFENELKWTTTEPDSQGCVNYTLPDAMLNFTKSHGLIARGHTVLWESRNANPKWLANLTINDREELWAATSSRLNSVMNRYKGQFIHWDVVNENMHHNFMTDILGPEASTVFYQEANKVDPNTLLFLNEFFTIEKSSNRLASPWNYLQKIWELRNNGYKGPLGIGLQSHFSEFNLPYLRASIDVMNSAKLPIWITELDVANYSGPYLQAQYLEEIMRELHAHEAVQGIMIWGGWWPNGACWRMCLLDDNFKNLATADVVDKIRAEWTYASGLNGTTAANGHFETSLYYGDYEATISHPKLVNGKSAVQKFQVAPFKKAQDVVFKICA